MSYINEIEFDFEIGDQYDVSPAEGSYIIGRILAIGGECYVDGNTIIVTDLPGKTLQIPAPVEAPGLVDSPLPTEPDLSPAENLADSEEAVVEAPVVEVKASAEVPSETPIRRPRKPVVKNEEEPIQAPVKE